MQRTLSEAKWMRNPADSYCLTAFSFLTQYNRSMIHEQKLPVLLLLLLLLPHGAAPQTSSSTASISSSTVIQGVLRKPPELKATLTLDPHVRSYVNCGGSVICIQMELTIENPSEFPWMQKISAAGWNRGMEFEQLGADNTWQPLPTLPAPPRSSPFVRCNGCYIQWDPLLPHQPLTLSISLDHDARFLDWHALGEMQSLILRVNWVIEVCSLNNDSRILTLKNHNDDSCENKSAGWQKIRLISSPLTLKKQH